LEPIFCQIVTHSTKEDKGRPFVDLERMLRMSLIANWVNLMPAPTTGAFTAFATNKVLGESRGPILQPRSAALHNADRP
jgi:hypothetical protein